MIVCSSPECQTTAGCKCKLLFSPNGLAVYTDEEIATEHHRRMTVKLGDQRVCVGLPLSGSRP